MKLLNLGAGACRPGEPWTNLDNLHETLLPGTPERANLDAETNYVNHDITKTLPFEDNTFDGILMSHVLEHFDCQEGVSIMRECYRTLKHGGELVVSVPNPRTFYTLEEYDTPENAVEVFGEPIHPGDGEITFFGYALWNRFHKSIIDSFSLWAYFRRAGFVSSNIIDQNGQLDREVYRQLNRLKFSLVMSGIK